MHEGETMAKMLGRSALWGSGCHCWDCCGFSSKKRMHFRKRTTKQREARQWRREGLMGSD